jgi:hypothetical protein
MLKVGSKNKTALLPRPLIDLTDSGIAVTDCPTAVKVGTNVDFQNQTAKKS